MVGHGAKLGRKQEAAIQALLTQPSLEAAARIVGVAPNTLLRWQQEPEFAKEYRKARLKAFGQGTARLQHAASAAVSAMLKILVDPKALPSTKLRAADLVLTHGAKAIEIEDIEARVSDLEQAAELSKESR